MEKPPRPPAHLQDDPGAYGTRCVQRAPDKNRTGDDGHLQPLRGGQGHGAAHARILPGVGPVPLHSMSRHRREIGPLGDRRSDAERAAEIRGSQRSGQKERKRETLTLAG